MADIKAGCILIILEQKLCAFLTETPGVLKLQQSSSDKKPTRAEITTGCGLTPVCVHILYSKMCLVFLMLYKLMNYISEFLLSCSLKEVNQSFSSSGHGERLSLYCQAVVDV